MPPIALRSLVRLASWLVPRCLRCAWHARWKAGLESWWILLERGELIEGASLQIARTIRTAFVDAFWQRFNRGYLQYWVRGPAFVISSAAVILLLLAAATRGFAVTRALISVALGHAALWVTAPEGPQGTLIAYTVPMLFALTAGIVLVAIGRLLPHQYGWRYWSFLAAKTGAALGTVSLLWIEGGTALRAQIPNLELRALAGGVVVALLFVVAFVWALLASLDDQRRRCPVCLRRLAMPVTIGSWGSVFEPATTELLCDEGHGALCLSETGSGESDRWIALDASWHDLFETARAGAQPRR